MKKCKRLVDLFLLLLRDFVPSWFTFDGECGAHPAPLAFRASVVNPLFSSALQLAHLLAERGLGMAERRRGAADAARPHGGDERPQQRDLKILGHKNSLCQLQQIDDFLMTWRMI